MLVEGTRALSTLDSPGVSAANASLPSSSSSKPPQAEIPEAGGTAPTAAGTEDAVTVELASIQTNDAQASRVAGSPAGAEAAEANPALAGVAVQEEAEETRVPGEDLNRISEEIEQQLNERLQLKFLTDEETGLDLFQLVEQETGEVVRQIPSDEIVEFVKRFRTNNSGLFVSEQA